jgi:hypothetical protein
MYKFDSRAMMARHPQRCGGPGQGAEMNQTDWLPTMLLFFVLLVLMFGSRPLFMTATNPKLAVEAARELVMK